MRDQGPFQRTRAFSTFWQSNLVHTGLLSLPRPNMPQTTGQKDTVLTEALSNKAAAPLPANCIIFIMSILHCFDTRLNLSLESRKASSKQVCPTNILSSNPHSAPKPPSTFHPCLPRHPKHQRAKSHPTTTLQTCATPTKTRIHNMLTHLLTLLKRFYKAHTFLKHTLRNENA